MVSTSGAIFISTEATATEIGSLINDPDLHLCVARRGAWIAEIEANRPRSDLPLLHAAGSSTIASILGMMALERVYSAVVTTDRASFVVNRALPPS